MNKIIKIPNFYNSLAVGRKRHCSWMTQPRWDIYPRMLSKLFKTTFYMIYGGTLTAGTRNLSLNLELSLLRSPPLFFLIFSSTFSFCRFSFLAATVPLGNFFWQPPPHLSHPAIPDGFTKEVQNPISPITCTVCTMFIYTLACRMSKIP